ncbi:MAG: hypothetical protein J5794_05295 [Lachnospiraceae bacterium]|nr:hypothetical protein [Lachnospiraceae bacterium]
MAEKKNKYPWIKSLFRKKPLLNQVSGVYAGPEQMGGAQNPKPDDGPIDVYAGPEYYEPKAVYAGPEYFDASKRVYAGPQLMVYAGPEYFKNRKSDLGAPAPEPALEDPDTVCEESANKVPEGSRKCTACGHVYPADQPFCPECGTASKQDETLT